MYVKMNNVKDDNFHKQQAIKYKVRKNIQVDGLKE